MATFGKTTNGASSTLHNANRKILSQVTLSEAATLTSMTIRARTNNTTETKHWKGLIYADNAGAPGALLHSTAEGTFLSTSVAAYTANFASETLPAGTYWIGPQYDANATTNVIIYRDNTATSAVSAVDTYSDGPLNPAGTMASLAGPVDAFVTYTAYVAPPSVSLLQTKTATSTTNYVNGIELTTTNAVADNSVLVLIMASTTAHADTTVVTDNNGNTWTKLLSKASSTRTADMWYTKNANPGITTVYVSSPDNYTQKAIVLREYSGLSVVEPLEESAFTVESGYNQVHTLSIANEKQPGVLVGGFAGSAGTGVFSASGASGNLIQANAETTVAVTVDDFISDITTRNISLTGDLYEEGVFLGAVFTVADNASAPVSPYKRFNGTEWVSVTATKISA